MRERLARSLRFGAGWGWKALPGDVTRCQLLPRAATFLEKMAYRVITALPLGNSKINNARLHRHLREAAGANKAELRPGTVRTQ